MKHYIDQNGVVYAYEANGSQDHLIGGKTPIEGDALVAALADAGRSTARGQRPGAF